MLDQSRIDSIRVTSYSQCLPILPTRSNSCGSRFHSKVVIVALETHRKEQKLYSNSVLFASFLTSHRLSLSLCVYYNSQLHSATAVLYPSPRILVNLSILSHPLRCRYHSQHQSCSFTSDNSVRSIHEYQSFEGITPSYVNLTHPLLYINIHNQTQIISKIY